MGKIFCVIAVIAVCLAGCRSAGQPVIIDTADFERVRYEFEQLRGEYAALQQAHRELTESSRFYAEFYRGATAAIERGLGELHELGADSLSEIARLRELTGILGSIIQVILDAGADAPAGER